MSKNNINYNNQWLEQTKKKAETDQYINAILKYTIQIMENNDYARLFNILVEYDKSVKRWCKSESMPVFENLPFWCCPL